MSMFKWENAAVPQHYLSNSANYAFSESEGSYGGSLPIVHLWREVGKSASDVSLRYAYRDFGRGLTRVGARGHVENRGGKVGVSMLSRATRL